MDPEFNTFDDKLNTFKGNRSLEGLRELKIRIALLQAASLLAIEGNNRATASQVAERAMREYEIEATPSYIGQIFSTLGIGSSITHGKSRFVLEQARLDEIRKALEVRLEETASRLQEAIEFFKNLPERIDNLEKDWQAILASRRKEQELLRTLNIERSKPSHLGELQAELAQYKERAKYGEQLKAECAELAETIKKQPSLEARKKKLEERIAKYSDDMRNANVREKEIAAKEQQLVGWLNRLHERNAWASLADVLNNLQEKKAELDQVSRQLGEKRSLLDKLLQRNKGVTG